jgi:hypothetical protein
MERGRLREMDEENWIQRIGWREIDGDKWM